MANLAALEKQCLALRYGDVQRVGSYAEVARELGTSELGARRIEQLALRKLRRLSLAAAPECSGLDCSRISSRARSEGQKGAS